MSNSIHKSYNSIAELPTEVRASFDETDQKKWMDLYNEKSDGKSDEDTVKESKEYAWLNMMDAPSGLAVETWGSVEVMDADGEVVNIDSLEEHCDDFINHGGRINEDHSNLPIGSAWKWERAKNPETGQDGIKFWFNIYGNTQTTENARQEILSGEKRSVSIGADAPRGDYKCDEKGCYVERNVTDYYELSLCQSPSNPNANFIAINGETIQKSRKHNKGDIVVKISDMTVHKDYTVCPLQNVKRNLIKSGYKDTHITGKHDITVKGIKRDNLMKILNESVSKCRYREIAPGSYQIRMTKESKNVEIDPDKDIQQYIKFAMDNEYAYESNNKILLCKKCPESFFKQMYDKGYLQCVSNYWGFRGDEKIAEGGSAGASGGGSMGVGSAGASNSIYGKRPQSLINQKKKVKKRLKKMNYKGIEINNVPVELEDKIKQDIENNSLYVADSVEEALVSFIKYNDKGQQVIDARQCKNMNRDEFYAEIRLNDGRAIYTYDIIRSIPLDRVRDVISFEQGTYTVFGNVAVDINEDTLNEDFVIYYPYFI